MAPRWSGLRTAAISGSAFSSTGIGIFGSSQNIGVLGQGAIGVLGSATTSSSTVFQANGSGGTLFSANTSGTPEFSVSGFGDVTANGVVRAAEVVASTVIAGGYAQLITSDGVAVFAQVTNPSDAYGVIEAVGAGGPLFTAFGSGDTEVAGLDNVGNLGISGQLFTSGLCSSGCIKHGPNQKRIVSYAPRESQPTMEDFGEAQVVNGEAHVTLDPSFANVIERAANYLVFVTPEGDCNGLFIAGKSSTGFVVRELRGGHSSLEFEYRIVAKPFGDRSARLPEVVVHPDLTLNSRQHRAPTHA
jgi:hypothetical protein